MAQRRSRCLGCRTGTKADGCVKVVLKPQAWLPQGPEDPSIVLIKFNGHSAEYWDTPGGRVASVISFVRAKVTGERYEGGSNEKVLL